MAEIEIKNLHKSFSDFIAVKNSNLIIENKLGTSQKKHKLN